MLTLTKILAATDFSKEAEWAMAHARMIARMSGAELHVLHAEVLHGDTIEKRSAEPANPDRLRDDLERHSQAFATRDGLDVPVNHVLSRNISAAPAILDYAEEENVDLIVIGTHGRRGVRRLLMGSVAEEVVRVAECPVVTVRSPDGDLPSRVEIASILVPIDFSAHSEHALRHAHGLAKVLGARLELLHVVEETLHPAFYGMRVRSVYDVDPHVEEKACTHMREMFARIEEPVVPVEFEARPGRAAAAITEFARERGSGLIVMGTHGLTGLEHFLMGSTTERVLRRSTVPVFTVKSFGKSLVPFAVRTAGEGG